MPEGEKKKGGFTGVIIALIAKSAKLLKFISVFKVAKPLLMLATMSVSVIAYAFYLGPWLALIFVGLLFVHEMGHVIAMRIKGLGTPTPVFIPFLGAAIFAPKFTDRNTEAFVGYGGPLLGSIGSIAVFGLWFLVPHDSVWSPILFVGSYLGVYLNLFNLLPISPLDGGRITQASGRWFKYIGLFALAGFSVFFREPVILYVWILVLFDLDIIPVRMRAVLVSVIWVCMAGLMSLGYGDQPVWVNVLDCVITLPFVILTIMRARKLADDVEPDARPELSSTERTRWFLVYLGLTILLVATLVFQAQFLEQVHDSVQ